jgi:hypothetical protein
MVVFKLFGNLAAHPIGGAVTVVDVHVALFCHEEDARAQQSEESLLHGRMFVLQSCGRLCSRIRSRSARSSMRGKVYAPASVPALCWYIYPLPVS